MTGLGILQCLEPVVSSFLFAAPISFSASAALHVIGCQKLVAFSMFTVNARLAPLLILAFFLLKKAAETAVRKGMLHWFFSCCAALLFDKEIVLALHCLWANNSIVQNTAALLNGSLICEPSLPLKPSNHFFGLVTLLLDVVSTNWLAFYHTPDGRTKWHVRVSEYLLF